MSDKVKKNAKDKKKLWHMSAEKKKQQLACREQQPFLVPGSPVKKQKRNVSQSRMPLQPNMKRVPPPQKRQLSQQKRTGLRSGGPTENPGPSSAVSDPLSSTLAEVLPAHSVGTVELPSHSREVNSLDESMDAIADRKPIIDVMNPGCDNQDNDEEMEAFDIVNIAHSRTKVLYPDETHNLQDDVVKLLKEIDDKDDDTLYLCNGGNIAIEDIYFHWNRDENIFMGQRETFTGQPGPTFNKEEMSPLEVFQKIWDQEIINLIVKETNRYAQQLKSADPSCMLQSWTDVTSDEIWMFFAVIMLQSIFPIPVEKEYWYPCLPCLKIGDLNSMMPYARFTMIKKCLHFVDNMSLAKEDNINLNKISPIIDHLNNKFSSLYLPEQNIVIDESLLMWKGRLSHAQMIATKAAKVGINSYDLCESRTGYLWKMRVYTGKCTDSQIQTEQDSDNKPEGTTSHIVYDLVRPLLNKDHTLVMDNLNTPMLSRILKHEQTDTLGTFRVHREFVPESILYLYEGDENDTRVGEVITSYTHDLTVFLWHDFNMVSMITTFQKTRIGGIEKFGYYKYVPQAALDYNLAMAGLDTKDQTLQAFPMERLDNTVWYKKLFHRLLNVSIYNAFVIYNHGKIYTHRQFRVDLLGEIIKKNTRSQRVKVEPLSY